MSFTNGPSSSFSPSNTVINVETQSTISPTQDPSFSGDNHILHWKWDESLPFSDTLLSTFSALPSSNGNDQRGDLDVEVESSYGGLHYHTEEFLETLTSRDPSGFDDPSRTCSPIPLTCTSDGLTFDPQRVKINPQNNHPGPIPSRALARGVDASSSKNASMSSVFHEKTVTRTPQQFLNMYHTLNTLVNMEDELSATAQPANPLEAQEPRLHLPADMANELPSLPELSTISNPKEPLGQHMTYQEFEDACNNLLTLNAEYGAQIPQNAVDALPPSAFLKQSSEHNTTNYGEFQAVVQDVTCNHVDWDNHDMGMEQLSAVHVQPFNAAGDYLMSDTTDNASTLLPSQPVVEFQGLGENLYNSQPLIQSFAGQLQTIGTDDVQNFEKYSPYAPSAFGEYTYTEGNVSEQAHFSESSSLYFKANYANINMTGWGNNTTDNLAAYNLHNTTWTQHITNDSISQAIVPGSSSHGVSSQSPCLNPANLFGIVNPGLNMFQSPQNQHMPATPRQLPQHIPSPQPPITHPDHPAAATHHPLQPLVPDTLSTPQTPQKRKREGQNRASSVTARPSKRQMLADDASLTSSAGPELSLILPSVDSLPPDDHRRKEPYTRGSNKNYICQYPVGVNETCGVVIVLKRGQRNWKRHLRTHAKREVQMLESGAIDVNSEKIYALLWTDKITVKCPDSDCTFSTEVWRTDGVLDEHLAKFHPDRYREKMECQSQRGSGRGKGKKNG
ncbi:hypothetical protein Clacol_004408 [Clathrus columnatus]|uniref:C2H2-type domain-containing protein n=1 Tax=Clathrus columnatus TaxID=1419009 RepID=A0AAV5A9E0_9AGAM|nr:hypothetical protein Clacol_004408 [Clathrus columnatus]